jgi:hypothetical protein
LAGGVRRRERRMGTRVRVPSGTRTVWNAQNPAGFQVFLEDAGLLDLSM